MQDAYIVDGHLFTDFGQVVEYIHDSFTELLPNEADGTHRFNIARGQVTPGKEWFISLNQKAFRLQYETEYELYRVVEEEAV
jgi:hypothetical protein